jgi:general secretion pathway protein G
MVAGVGLESKYKGFWKGIQMKRTRPRNKAFTIVELLVVILIISMLAVFVAPRFIRTLGKAKRDIAKAKMRDIEGALDRFFLGCGRYPYESETLEILASVEGPEDLEEGKWTGPYLKRSELIDPWGNPYIYIEQGQVNPGSYDLISCGADGQTGGEGENEDIYND